MCGQFVIYDSEDIKEIQKIINEINKKYNGSNISAKTGTIRPTNCVPILSLIDEKPSLSIMKWGFPKWDSKGVIINARAETATEKKIFVKPFIEKRCVVPCSGFFEWDKNTQPKDKYLFKEENSNMLYLAGIYNAFNIEDEIIDRFVILTREANQYISDIHDRMPVILHKNELSLWLKDERFAREACKRDNIVLERKIAG